jgi:hypothetical protein
VSDARTVKPGEAVKRRGFEFTVEGALFLEIDDIWPDGDAPPNPTVDDVIKVISECGGPRRVMADWDLDAELRLAVDGHEVRP